MSRAIPRGEAPSRPGSPPANSGGGSTGDRGLKTPLMKRDGDGTLYPPVVVGIDNALIHLGWAILRGSKPTIDAGAANFTRRAPHERLEAVSYFVRELLALVDERPAILALEDTWIPPFVGRDGKKRMNAQTVIKLSELRGALTEIGRNQGFQVIRVNPKTWQATTGIPRNAKRQQVKAQSLRVAKLRSGLMTLTSDSADAVNLGWHVYHETKRAAAIGRMRA